MLPATRVRLFSRQDNFGLPTYLYGMNTAFVASAHTEYWLSIVPDLHLFPQWGWLDGSGGDGAG
jgi:hypothetical protein